MMLASGLHDMFTSAYEESRFPAPGYAGRRLRSTANNEHTTPLVPLALLDLLNQGLRVAFGSGAVACRLRGALRTGFCSCLLLICAFLLWPAPGAYAQTQAEAPEESAVQQAETEAVEAEAAESESETESEEAEESEPIPIDLDKPPGRFIPSEEISEDWSVPFPVDI
jgi:hypothetical protein